MRVSGITHAPTYIYNIYNTVVLTKSSVFLLEPNRKDGADCD